MQIFDLQEPWTRIDNRSCWSFGGSPPWSAGVVSPRTICFLLVHIDMHTIACCIDTHIKDVVGPVCFGCCWLYFVRLRCRGVWWYFESWSLSSLLYNYTTMVEISNTWFVVVSNSLTFFSPTTASISPQLERLHQTSSLPRYLLQSQFFSTIKLVLHFAQYKGTITILRPMFDIFLGVESRNPVTGLLFHLLRSRRIEKKIELWRRILTSTKYQLIYGIVCPSIYPCCLI